MHNTSLRLINIVLNVTLTNQQYTRIANSLEASRYNLQSSLCIFHCPYNVLLIWIILEAYN